MEFKNSSNNNEGDGQQQLRRSARIRKLNKLANEDKPAGREVQSEPEDCSSSKKSREEGIGNDLNLEMRRFDDYEENTEKIKSSEINLPNNMEEEKEPKTLSNFSQHRQRRLPLELECEIFKCLKLPIQCKFIWGLGRGIYAMSRHKVLTKSKRLCNPPANRWMPSNTSATVTISPNGLAAQNGPQGQNLFAELAFPLAVAHSRPAGEFPGTVVYYFEVTHTQTSPFRRGGFVIGLSDKRIPADSWVGRTQNSYGFLHGFNHCHLSAGQQLRFEWPQGAIRPEWNPDDTEEEDVIGCGLLLNPQNEWAIFFTAQGILMGGKPIPINPLGDCLFPTVSMWRHISVEANFGHKPFKYDIQTCPRFVGIS